METLQRIYGISFPDSKMMKDWEKFQEEAKSRDHRKIGKVRPPAPHHTGALYAPHRTKPYNTMFPPLLCAVLLTLTAGCWRLPCPHSELMSSNQLPLSFARVLKSFCESLFLSWYKLLITFVPTWWCAIYLGGSSIWTKRIRFERNLP